MNNFREGVILVRRGPRATSARTETGDLYTVPAALVVRPGPSFVAADETVVASGRDEVTAYLVANADPPRATPPGMTPFVFSGGVQVILDTESCLVGVWWPPPPVPGAK